MRGCRGGGFDRGASLSHSVLLDDRRTWPQPGSVAKSATAVKQAREVIERGRTCLGSHSFVLVRYGWLGAF